MKQLLKSGTTLNKYKVGKCISTHHGGEREVYFAEVPESREKVVLTVFNLSGKRCQVEKIGRKKIPDFIEEVNFLRARGEGCKRFATVVDCGITRIGKKKLGWMAQEVCQGESLANVLEREGVMNVKNAVKVMKALTTAVGEIMHFTRGGGHYGISLDNILVDFDEENNVREVKLIGLTNIGPMYHGAVPFGFEGCDQRFRAPETLKGSFTHQTDIYALGVVLGMMLCGVPEREDYQEGGAEIEPAEYRRSLTESFKNYLSAPLRIIVERATETSAHRRFQTVDKLQYFLDKYCGGRLRSNAYVEGQKSNPEASAENDGKERDDDSLIEGSSLKRRTGRPYTGSKVRTETKMLRESKFKVGNPRGHGLDDVAGMDELKAKFRRNFVEILRHPQIAKQYGITPCNCMLLYGPQGCGKTYIAEAAAREAGLKYRIVNPSDLGSIYIHGAQAKIAETFKEAEKNAPIILIFDEFDAIAPKRDGDINPNQANEVNELLTRLNNCAEKGVYILATTNRPELIDSAVLRTGRVDEIYYVSLPDFKARHDIFNMELSKRPCESDINLDALAQATENYTCSDLSYIVKESARRCFNETITSGSQLPIPLSQRHLLDVIKATRPSVSPAEMKSYKEMRERIERRNGENRHPRIGFAEPVK